MLLDVVLSGVPGGGSSLAQETHADRTGVDDSNVVTGEELERTIHQTLIYQRGSAVGQHSVNAA